MALDWMSAMLADSLDSAIRDAKQAKNDLIRCAGIRKRKGSLCKEPQHGSDSFGEKTEHGESMLGSPRASLPGLTSLTELNEILAFHCAPKQPCPTFAAIGQKMFAADDVRFSPHGSLQPEHQCVFDPEPRLTSEKVQDCSRNLCDTSCLVDLAHETQENQDITGFPEVTFAPAGELVISQDVAGSYDLLKPKLMINLSPCLLQVASIDTPREELPGEISPIILNRQPTTLCGF